MPAPRTVPSRRAPGPFAPVPARAWAVAGGLALVLLACEQAGLPADPNAQMPTGDKIKPAIDTRTHMADAPGAEAGGGAVSGTVRLADGAQAGGGTLFVIARKAGVAGGPPLAVARLDGASFPATFTIGQENVMIPSNHFEGDVSLTARLDADGNPMTQAEGDLAGEVGRPVAVGTSGIEIVLGAPGAAPGMGAPAGAVAPAPSVAGAADGPSAGGASGEGGLSGTLSLAAGATPPAGGVIYVMVRPAGQVGGPPLAVKRLTPGAWPLAFALGPGDIMIPGGALTGDLSVTARLDADGDAMTKGPEDLNGAAAAPVKLGATGVAIELKGL